MLRITQPFHGAVVNAHHGRPENGVLRIKVVGDCPSYGSVTVNGFPAVARSGEFTATVALTDRETDIAAIYDGAFGHHEHRVRVVWDKHSFPRYRVSLDDNSFFLRDIARNQYDSIFDCHYLSLLRRMNREYGAKFTCNIYYEADDGFDIRDFPDKYKREWEGCADWLGLAFHAYADKPDRPYQYASPEKLIHDMSLVCDEIVRFAGEQSLVPPTVIHWGMVVPQALPVLYEHGVRALSGYMEPHPWGYDVNYWLDDARSEYLWHHDCLKDFASGIVFSRVDIVINTVPIERISSVLEPLAQDPNHAEIMDLFTHEQYFWDFYENYIPDHPQRLELAIRWVTERGYRPVFFHQGFLGVPL